MKTIIALSFILVSSIAWADCKHNGRTYPEGTVLGPMVCSGGSWK